MFSAIFPGCVGFLRPVFSKTFGGLEDWFREAAKVIILDRMKQEGVREVNVTLSDVNVNVILAKFSSCCTESVNLPCC